MEQLVLREGDLFLVADSRGDLDPARAACGLFFRDTRCLSRFQVTGAADRQRVIAGGIYYERMEAAGPVAIAFGADFADLFEVRGYSRSARGVSLPPAVEEDRVTLGYRGLDGVERRTVLRFTPAPDSLTGEQACWQNGGAIEVAMWPEWAGHRPDVSDFATAAAALERSYARWRAGCTAMETESEALNRVLAQSVADLRLLTADLGHGPFSVAGIPWFAVPFGRDSLLTALFALGLNPDLARGTLRTLAAYQGRTVDAFRLEEPGKILHELRFGEMAALGEVPFGRYYGTVDATPLFLVLAAEYYAWTGDLGLVWELLDPIHRALHWLEHWCDPDGDGFLQFRPDTGRGLVVQSWKDSADSMSHRDGRLAEGALAVSEVQGYAYDAMRRLAPVLKALGDRGTAARLAARAEALKERFDQAYWMDDQQCPTIALDGAGRQVGTVASDMGHCLWSGLLAPARAAAVARRLLEPDLFTGWGIRTLSARERRYDPLSYHNGSVWPHDTAICAIGLKRAGFDAEAAGVAGAMLEAAFRFDQGRLPELFGGFDRTGDGEGPVPYPAACSPQAWAAATPPALLLLALLGLEPDAAAGVLRVRPFLPDWVGWVSLKGLRVGTARVDLEARGRQVRARVDGPLVLRVE